MHCFQAAAFLARWPSLPLLFLSGKERPPSFASIRVCCPVLGPACLPLSSGAGAVTQVFACLVLSVRRRNLFLRTPSCALLKRT